MYLNRVLWRNPLDELRREMGRLLDGRALNPLDGDWNRPAYPPLNIWDDGDALALEAEVPGVASGDLQVYAVGNELTVKGHRNPTRDESRAYQRRERIGGEFSRVVTLPVEIDADKIEATLRDGVLSLKLPKAETAKPRQITVKSTQE